MRENPRRSARINLAFALATALASPSCASEAEPQWTRGASLDELASDLGGSDLGVDARGNAIAVWSRQTERGLSSRDHTIWAARFQPGADWGPPKKLGSSGKRGASTPVLAVNSKGQAVASWWEWASDRDDQAGEGIWAARFDPNEGWDDAVLVGEAGVAASVAINSNGQAVLVWVRPFDAIFVSHLDPPSGWSAPTRLDRDCIPPPPADEFAWFPNESGVDHPKVAMNDAGNALVVWDDNEGEADALGFCEDFTVRASSYVPGVGWSTPTKLGVRSSLYGNLHAALAVDESGRGLAGSLIGDVRSYGADEGWSSLDFGIDRGVSSVAMAESGHAIVVREVRSDDVFPGSVLAVRFSPLEGWSEPETISVPFASPTGLDAAPKSPTILDSSGADVAVNDTGECIVVWHQVALPAISDSHFTVWASRFAPGPGWSSPTLLSADGSVDAFFPRVTIDGQGRGIAVWTEAPRAFESPGAGRLMWSRLD